MTKIADIQHTRILAGLNPLANLSERPRMGVCYTLTSCRRRSVNKKELLESLKVFGKARKTARKSSTDLVVHYSLNKKTTSRVIGDITVFAQQYNESTGGKHLCSCLQGSLGDDTLTEGSARGPLLRNVVRSRFHALSRYPDFPANRLSFSAFKVSLFVDKTVDEARHD